MLRRVLRSPLFPYTTLFRSRGAFDVEYEFPFGWSELEGIARSEEHTSELQSLRHLVCRLLLEKKKTVQQECRDRTRMPQSARKTQHTATANTRTTNTTQWSG